MKLLALITMSAAAFAAEPSPLACQGGDHPATRCKTCEHCQYCGKDKGRFDNSATCVVCEKAKAAYKRPTK